MATSTLNPNAPIFVPSAYRMVDDFSDQWWDLVRSSPSFRDYWLLECFSDPQNDPLFADIYDSALPDFDFDFDFDIDFDFFPSGDTISPVPSKEEEKNSKDLISLGVLKWQKTRVGAEVPRYAEKAPKIVKAKVGPRTIQQPR